MESFSRVEKKYLLSRAKCDDIIKVLQTRMILDDYGGTGGKYGILSLYYDTPHNRLIREALSTPRFREKLRLRAYSIPQPGDMVYLEIKRKTDGVGYKRRLKLPLDDAYQLIKTGECFFAPKKDSAQVFREVTALLHRHDKNLNPAAIIGYDRLAFDGCEDKGLRISFDTDLYGRTYDLRLESGTYGRRLIDSNLAIMEIKVLQAMPLWLARLLSAKEAGPRGFSKYRALYHCGITSYRYPGVHFD